MSKQLLDKIANIPEASPYEIDLQMIAESKMIALENLLAGKNTSIDG